MDGDTREILETLREVSSATAALREKVEAHLESTRETRVRVDKMEVKFEMVHRHETFMKVSLWVYGIFVSLMAGRYFTS